MDYFRPRSVAEAVMLGQNPGVTYLGGGTDLVLQMRQGKVSPQGLVDLGNVAELKEIRRSGDTLEIGSMVTFTDLVESKLVNEGANALWLACQSMGSPAIRNQATIGGNLGNCSPAADALPALLALGAGVSLSSRVGEEVIPLTTLLERYPLLVPGTLIRNFIVPVRLWQSGFAKLGRRRALAIARLSVALAVQTEDNTVTDLRIAFGAVGKRAFLSSALAGRLLGREFDAHWREEAVHGAQELVREALQTRASAPYKSVAVGGVMHQALTSLQ
ncbi:MAG: FAD binding domain-containing protein [Desulfitobacteriaceae bacterium]